MTVWRPRTPDDPPAPGVPRAVALPARVPLADIFDQPPPEPAFWVDALIPEEAVTLLGAHGGTGKTLLGLMVAVCLTIGRPFMGKATRTARTVFYSAEEPRKKLQWRVAQICRHMAVDPREIDGNLIVLDATDCDPVLFGEISDGGVRHGITTAMFGHLETFDADVFIIDNASDAYDAGENDRGRVRGFIRALAQLVKARAGAVLLLAHIDKSAARGTGGSEGYAGSTAWHNSVRSRLFLSEQDGELILEHQKSNYGRRAEPIRMQWAPGGVLELIGAGASVAGLVASADRQAVVDLIAEFYERGEYLPTSPNAPSNAFKSLKDDPEFPARMDRSKFFRVLRDAERAGLVDRETYVTANRKERERWRPVAPSTPSARQVEPGTPVSSGAPPAPTTRGVIGGRERTKVGADLEAWR